MRGLQNGSFDAGWDGRGVGDLLAGTQCKRFRGQRVGEEMTIIETDY